ncbi:MAG: NAD-dependent epimerase/dehydratase family protein [Deltaproteobacteria bacterium]|nr:NAD-dependent epimerase/dehydratase family protein [Deltaproteobacteria bacterium]
MRILITGATGFIGGAITRVLLANGYNLRTVCRNQQKGKALAALGLEIQSGDLHNHEVMQRAVKDVDLIIHAAGLTIEPTPGDFNHANIEITRLLLEAAAAEQNLRRFVFISSIFACGPAPKDNDLTETTLCHPVSAYGRSKYKAESLVRAFADSFNFTIIRAPLVYGPGDRKLGPLFKMAKFGLLPTVVSEHTRVSLLHINDLAEGTILAALHDKAANQTFIFAEEPAPTVKELYDVISKTVGKEVTIIHIPAILALGAALVAEGVARASRRSFVYNPDALNDLLGDNWQCSSKFAKETINFSTRMQWQQEFSHYLK